MSALPPAAHRLVVVAQALFTEGETLAALVSSGPPPPPGGRLEGEVSRVLAETLAAGATRLLLRGGAWREGFFDAAGRPVRGRVWERHPEPPQIGFGPASAQLLAWLAAGAPGGSPAGNPGRPVIGAPAAKSPVWSTLLHQDRATANLGDHLLLLLGLDRLGDLAPGRALARWPPARRSALLWLAHADRLALDGEGGYPKPEDFAAWVTGDGALVLETLQRHLASSWYAAEGRKGGLDAEHLRRVGEAQEAVLLAFLAAVDAAGRRDLALFLVEAGVRLRSEPFDAARVLAGLDARSPLADRQAAARAAGALPRAILHWRRWDDEHRSVGYVDDGYERAQLLLSRGERLDTAYYRSFAALLHQLESLGAKIQTPDSKGGIPQ